MKILLAPDSFKDCLSAKEVALELAGGIHRVRPGDECLIIPVADGGEGTVEAVVEASGGRMLELPVLDPLLREISATYGISGDGRTAVIEMAAASGLPLLRSDERNPWHTSSFGTGQLIRHALDQGCEQILLGIGGSATNDGGAGMAAALGARFETEEGKLPVPAGGMLGRLRKISMDELHPRIGEVEIRVACDVNNPLTGPQGASRIYAEQKGADREMIAALDHNLHHFATLIHQQLGKQVDQVPGAGAAGGMGAGLLAFLDARLEKGFPLIASVIGLEDKMIRADWVITGEGRLDGQTRFGKTPWGVARLARVHQKPVIAVCGTLEESAADLYREGFDLLFSIQEKPMDLDAAIAQVRPMLRRMGERIGHMFDLFLK